MFYHRLTIYILIVCYLQIIYLQNTVFNIIVRWCTLSMCRMFCFCKRLIGITNIIFLQIIVYELFYWGIQQIPLSFAIVITGDCKFLSIILLKRLNGDVFYVCEVAVACGSEFGSCSAKSLALNGVFIPERICGVISWLLESHKVKSMTSCTEVILHIYNIYNC